MELNSHVWEMESDGEKLMKKKPKIILVDNKERFVFLPLLYELSVGDAEVSSVRK